MKRLLLGIAIGAGAMYFLDPEKGEERRQRLFGFYDENKDSFQEYAQSAAATAVTVGQTVGTTAGTVAEKAGTVAGKAGEKATAVAEKAGEKASAVAAKAEKARADAGGSNGAGSNVDTLLEKRNLSSSEGEAPGKGGSLSEG